ncbi:MAG: polysaccharide deacetylase family protein [Ignavibacterium sp.]|nr:MAG: polysaccharide deacetylase family protein [Ignavibacterium sp.]
MLHNINPPYLIKKIYSQFKWDTSNNKVLLTFDDGPNPGTTEKILLALNEFNIRALFFCVGTNVERYNSLTNQIIDEGHVVGNHTINHKLLIKLNEKDALREIKSFNSLMLENFNYIVRYFRPPFGWFKFNTGKMMQKTGLTCVMWNLVTYDYHANLEKVKRIVDNYLQSNSIIVLHDSNKTTDIIVDSIKYIVDKAGKHNFEFGAPEECLN